MQVGQRPTGNWVEIVCNGQRVVEWNAMDSVLLMANACRKADFEACMDKADVPIDGWGRH